MRASSRISHQRLNTALDAEGQKGSIVSFASSSSLPPPLSLSLSLSQASRENFLGREIEKSCPPENNDRKFRAAAFSTFNTLLRDSLG
jgi:hypothetical protein